MQQIDLLHHFPPAAHRHDPATSFKAAEQVTRSGARASSCERVLAALCKYPGHTSRELSYRARMDRHEVARRLADLVELGKARHGEARACSLSGRECLTFYPGA